MKRINETLLRPADIILTTGGGKPSKVIRRMLNSPISHAMIYVEHCSVIDSTSRGVKASNTQRLLFDDQAPIFALRLKQVVDDTMILRVCDYARSQIGVRYDKTGAVRSLRGRGPAAGHRQFCSRLVAKAYEAIGVLFLDNPAYCSPEHLRSSPLLESLGDITIAVSDAEIADLEKHPDLVREMWDAQDRLFEAARAMNGSIETVENLVQHAIDRPDRDARIARMIEASGYLDVWRRDREVNPWQYDLALMNGAPEQDDDIACYPLLHRPVLYWTDLLAASFLVTAADPGPDIKAMIVARLSGPGHAPQIVTQPVGRENLLSFVSGTRIAVATAVHHLSGDGVDAPIMREVHDAFGPARMDQGVHWHADNRNPALRQFLDLLSHRYARPLPST